MPGQLESEIARDGGYLLPASEGKRAPHAAHRKGGAGVSPLARYS